MEEKNKELKRGTKDKRFIFLSNFGIGKEKEYFIENLSMLVGYGIDILSALIAIKQEIRSKRMREIISDLEAQIKEGSPFWRALEENRIFPQHIISLVRIGEETGKLTENLKIIAIQEQKERGFRSKISSAMMYPAMVLFLTLFVG